MLVHCWYINFYELSIHRGNYIYFKVPFTNIQATIIYRGLFLFVLKVGYLHDSRPFDKM